jgi:hypothetical protein
VRKQHKEVTAVFALFVKVTSSGFKDPITNQRAFEEVARAESKGDVMVVRSMWDPGFKNASAGTMAMADAAGFRAPAREPRRRHVLVKQLLTGERDEGRPTASGEDGEQSSSAWVLREVNGAPVVLFTTVEVLDFGPRRARVLREKIFACQVSVVPSARGSRCPKCWSTRYAIDVESSSRPLHHFILCSLADILPWVVPQVLS